MYLNLDLLYVLDTYLFYYSNESIFDGTLGWRNNFR